MGATLDDRVRALLARAELRAAVTLVLEAFGPGIRGYLHAFMDEDDAEDAFSLFAENLFSGLRSWHGGGTLKAWTYSVARNAAKRMQRDTYRQRRERLRSSAASRLAASIVTSSGAVRGGRRDRLDRLLRETLSAEELSFFDLRVKRELDWNEIATVLAITAVAARKRYQRLKAKLERAARREGLVD